MPIAFFFILFISIFAETRTYLPSGCGTYTSCNDVLDANKKKQGEEVCTNASDKKIILIKANWKDDKLVGNFYCAQDDGTPVIEAQYKNGELHGAYKTYDSSEKKWNPPINYNEGKREGVAEMPGSNGYSRIVLFKNDVQHGFELLLKNGQIEDIRDCYDNGKRVDKKNCSEISIPDWDKKIKVWLKEKEAADFAENNKEVLEKWDNGNIKLKYKLVNSQITGPYLRFYENGKPQIERNYVDGYMTEEKIYFRETAGLESHSFFKKNWEYKLKQYYQNGNMKFEKEESKHPDDKWLTVINYTRYHDNGKAAETGKRIRAPASWGDGQYEGEIKFYSHKGELTDLQNWNAGKPHGLWLSVPTKGLYDYEQIYEKGVVVESRTIKKDSKKLMKKVEYYPDGSTKKEFTDPDFKEE